MFNTYDDPDSIFDEFDLIDDPVLDDEYEDNIREANIDNEVYVRYLAERYNSNA